MLYDLDKKRLGRGKALNLSDRSLPPEKVCELVVWFVCLREGNICAVGRQEHFEPT